LSRLTEGFRRASERDRRFVMELNLRFIDMAILPLFAAYLCLNFLDVYSTLLALKTSLFQEMNPIASTLFSLHFYGFLLALTLKYLPAIPLFYTAFVKDPYNRHPFELRLVRFVALVSLISADLYLTYVVAVNNIPTLLSVFA
jgi:hypothetical protein